MHAHDRNTMNTERIESLVRELIAFDPSLEAHAADLSVLVGHMIVERPTVTVDETFARALKTTLMVKGVRALVQPTPSVYTWALRLIPLGAVALLVFTLVPSRTHNLQPLPTTYDTSVSDVSMEMSDTRGVDMEADDTQPAPEYYRYGGDEAMHTKSAGPAHIPSPIQIETQSPGSLVQIASITTDRPSFVVITSASLDGTEEILGTSKILNSGTTAGVTVYLRAPIRSGGSYTISLYQDDGDRTFVKEEDFHATDLYGNPVTFPFSVSN